MHENDIATTEFDSAVDVARHALEEFRKEPMVPSKRGGDRLSGWWVVYRDSSAIAQRWHREIRVKREDQAPSAWQDEFNELDRLLDDSRE